MILDIRLADFIRGLIKQSKKRIRSHKADASHNQTRAFYNKFAPLPPICMVLDLFGDVGKFVKWFGRFASTFRTLYETLYCIKTTYSKKNQNFHFSEFGLSSNLRKTGCSLDKYSAL